MTSIMAVDPGKSGGIAVLHEYGVLAYTMPESDEELLGLCRSIQCDHRPTICYFEKVNGYMGNTKSTGSSGFVFGDAVGSERIAIKSCGIPLELVAPQTWQKELSIPPRKKGEAGESKTEWKKRLLARAQSLYPATFEGFNKGDSLQVADAVLLIEYGRRCRSF